MMRSRIKLVMNSRQKNLGSGLEGPETNTHHNEIGNCVEGQG